MSAPERAAEGRLDTVRAVLRTLQQAGLIDPRLIVSLVRAARRHGSSIATGFAANAMVRPDDVAVIDEQRQVTFRTLNDRMRSIAHGLRDLGIGPGSKLGILCRNHAGFIESMGAAGLLGADTIFLNTGFAGPQLRDVVEREGIEAILYDEEFAEIVRAAPESCARLLVWHEGEAEGPTLDRLAAHYAPDPVEKPPAPGRGTILTSGTTGTPKGAQRSSTGSDPMSSIGILEILPVRVGARALVSAPMFHSWGLAQLLMGSVLGTTFILQRRFDPENVLAAIDRHRAELLVVVPVMLQRILALGPERIGRYDTRSLRGTLASGSALPGELALRWMDTFGDNLYNFYGSTEVAQASIASPEDLRAAPGTAGRVPRGTVVKILDEKGREVPQGETGRIFVANAMQFEGYTGGGNKEIVDGMMSVGDLGWFDEDGRLFVGGRDDDMIVSGGENVFPREVEDLLSDREDVHEAAVIGVPDEEFGQRLRAFVVMEPGRSFDEDELKTFVKSRLARHKVPREVIQVDELPRNPTGKVLKRVLREWTPAAAPS
jgi:fatty-acyl-CoA synthase